MRRLCQLIKFALVTILLVHIFLAHLLPFAHAQGKISAPQDQTHQNRTQAISGAPTESQPESPDDNLLILQVVLNRLILSEGIIGYQDKDVVYLPLGEFARALEFNINLDIQAATASGWFIHENRKFHLDVNKNMVEVVGKNHPLRTGQVKISDDANDILVDIKTLEEWFPISLEFVPRDLTIQVYAHELLPIEIAMEREKKRRSLAKNDRLKTESYRQVEAPYKLASIPVMDITYNTNYNYNPSYSTNKNGDLHHQFASVMTGDLLYLNTNLFLLANDDQGLSQARAVMGRKDSRGILLGPFEATEFSLGDVYSPPIPLISNGQAGRGLNLSNFPMGYTSEFDSVQIRGDIEPDWEVELYRNESLLDFQKASADGTYNFSKVPLMSGFNSIKLVFYGPFNQQREKVYHFYMHPDLLQKGRFYYRLSVNQDDTNLIPVNNNQRTFSSLENSKEGKNRSIVECEYGLDERTSITSSMVSFALLDDNHRYNYISAGIRSSLAGIFGRFDFIKHLEADRGIASRTSLQTQLFGYSLIANHDHFSHDFISEYRKPSYDLSYDSSGNISGNLSESIVDNLLTGSTSLRLNGRLPMPLRLPSLSLEVTGKREDYSSGQRNINISNRISTSLRRFSISNNWQYNLTKGGAYGQYAQPYQNQQGNLLLSLHVLKWNLRGDITYDLYPDKKVNRGTLTSDYKLFDTLSLSAILNHQFQGEEATSYSLGLNKTYDNKKCALGFNTAYTDAGDYSAGLSISMSLGYDSEQKKAILTSRSLANSGTVAARVFLDENQNGQFDGGDVPLPEAEISISNTTQKESTNDQGITWVTGISPHRPVGITVDSSSLEDPYWILAEKGVEVITRPGVPVCLDFPVLATGEIEGTVYLMKDNAKAKPNADAMDNASANTDVNAKDNTTRKKEASNVELELIDPKGIVIKKTKTAFDGYYLFDMVPLSSYRVRIAEDQIIRLYLLPINTQEITLTKENSIISGIEFVLEHEEEKDRQRLR